jgi:hypothetical protein
MFILDGEADEEILTFDVPDNALERAAAASDGQAVTIGYCTHWYHCNWPMVVGLAGEMKNQNATSRHPGPSRITVQPSS